jgi:hypothetical protein
MIDFYTLRPEVVQYIAKHGLSKTESKLFAFLIQLDAFGDRPKKMKVAEILLATGIGKTAYHAAVAKFEALGWFDFTHKDVEVKNLTSKKSEKTNKQFGIPNYPSEKTNDESEIPNRNSEIPNRNSEKTDNRGSKVASREGSTTPQISSDLIRSDPDLIEDLENFDNSEAAQSAVDNSEISLDEAIAEIQKSISDDLEPDEALNDADAPEEVKEAIDGQFSRAAVETFVLRSLKSPPRDRKAYFAKFKPADWQKWELELRASVAPKRDPLIENLHLLENSIRLAIADKNIDFARTKIENLKATHPDLAQELETKFFGGAA